MQCDLHTGGLLGKEIIMITLNTAIAIAVIFASGYIIGMIHERYKDNE